jgi:hypothetical protein
MRGKSRPPVGEEDGMSEILDYKKAFKDYYQPSTQPGIIDVPE